MIEVWPAYEEFAFRIELWGDEIESLSIINPVTGEQTKPQQRGLHLSGQALRAASETGLKTRWRRFSEELARTVGEISEARQTAGGPTARRPHPVRHGNAARGRLLPGHRELQSRALAGRKPGEPPDTLYDFFPDDFLLFVDESHVTVPQVRAMYAGDQARKTTLVEHGFRLPMALDNRPLKFDEWNERRGQTIFVSATPSRLGTRPVRGRGRRAGHPPDGLGRPD